MSEKWIKYAVAMFYDKASEKEADVVSRDMIRHGSCVVKLPARDDYDYLEAEYSEEEVNQIYLANMKSVLVYGWDTCFFCKSRDNEIINELLDYSVSDELSCTAVYQTMRFDTDKYKVYEECGPFILLRSINDMNKMLPDRLRNAGKRSLRKIEEKARKKARQ